MTDQPTIKLNNGVIMPALGYGVFQTPPEETAKVVEHALRTGYRSLDTAAIYGNEAGVGEGIRNSGVAREDIFLETKIWPSDFGYEETLHAYDKAVAKLGVDYLDLLILHWPAPDRFERTIESYRALEKLYADGKVRAIGVSNFMPEQLEELLSKTEVLPVVNQIELNPYYQARAAEEANTKHGILTQAWSPMGGSASVKRIIADKDLNEIADKHGKTPVQVILRWHLQKGHQAIPKSVTPARIESNFDVFDFELTDAEMDTINALDTNERQGFDPYTVEDPMYDIVIPEA